MGPYPFQLTLTRDRAGSKTWISVRTMVMIMMSTWTIPSRWINDWMIMADPSGNPYSPPNPGIYHGNS
jgi:hypothetical protein